MGYLRGTIELGLVYGGSGKNIIPCGYSDSSFNDNFTRASSCLGGIVMMNGAGVIAHSQESKSVLTSTTTAEYAAAAQVALSVGYIRDLLDEIFEKESSAVEINSSSPDRGSTMLSDFDYITSKLPLPSTEILVDNEAAICIGMNPDLRSKRGKHIHIRFEIVREMILSKKVYLKYINTKEQIADIFTKCLAKDAFVRLRDKFMS
jgi:hypothetical protein